MTGLSPLGEAVRRHDPDRFYTALFAPAERRDALFTLYALNHELARAREVVREPTMALIRLQWWREVVEGARRRHEVAGPVGEALDAGLLHGPDLLGMIEGREAEIEAEPVPGELLPALLAAAGGLAVAAARTLGDTVPERFRLLGAAYGAAGWGRNAALRGAVVPELEQAVASAGRDWLQRGRGGMPRRVIAAALPAVFARRDLARAEPVTRRGIADKAAVLAAVLRGRV